MDRQSGDSDNQNGVVKGSGAKWDAGERCSNHALHPNSVVLLQFIQKHPHGPIGPRIAIASRVRGNVCDGHSSPTVVGNRVERHDRYRSGAVFVFATLGSFVLIRLDHPTFDTDLVHLIFNGLGRVGIGLCDRNQ